MNKTVSDAQDALKWLLDNASLATDVVIRGLNVALDSLTAYVPKRAKTTITGDGSTTTFALPTDFYAITAIVDSDKRVLSPKQVPEMRWLSLAGDEHNAYYISEEGKLTFLEAPSSGETLTLYYLAHWTHVMQVTDNLEPPVYLYAALLYRAGAFILSADATSAASLRQFNTRVDSGNPEHNPVQQQVEWLLSMFEREANRHRPKTNWGVLA